MQIILKRHSAFYDDIKRLEQTDQDDFFIKSIVTKNEIFYCVAKTKSSSEHLHIPMIQEKASYIYERGNKSTEDINPKIKELIEQIKNIISKI